MAVHTYEREKETSQFRREIFSSINGGNGERVGRGLNLVIVHSGRVILCPPTRKREKKTRQSDGFYSIHFDKT